MLLDSSVFIWPWPVDFATLGYLGKTDAYG